MKLVVTGGAGFIGSHFIRYILNNYPDYRVLNIDKLTYAGNIENIKDVENHPNYRFLKADICERGIEEAITDYDVVINFAAESHVDRSIQEPEAFLKTDVMGTFNLLEISRKKGIQRYIQISTDEVFGSADEGQMFYEESPLNPSSPYSASKAAADLLALSYYRTYKTPVIIIRSTNNYGPNQYPEKFIPLFITNAIEDKILPLYGDGKNVRDWLFVLDNCRGIDVILHRGKEGEIYNIAGGNEKENIFIAKKILEYLGKPDTLIKFVKDRPGHDRRYSISCEKIKRLGWQPIVSLEEGLKQTVGWYKNNEDWWKKIKNGEFLEYYRRYYEL
ncbi:MAG: dTDP-glucose 4,6-dehydratase [Candidatus Ratteibacteria bacterium]|nr:dTDP-glucose 4,6-dehydratase [Candidatus Ratteibacteria bacterium]